MSSDRLLDAPLSRRSALALGLATGVGVPLLSACGFSTSGGGGGDALTFLSTQFTPVEEGERFRKILKSAYSGPVNYVTAEPGPYNSRIKAETQAGKVTVNLLGGLYGDIAPLGTDRLEDLSGLADRLRDRQYASDVLELAKLGSDKTYFIPWMQATYVVAARKPALDHLPSGADVQNLTYDQFLAWAKAAKAANGGKPVFGLPGGPKGLLHRFFQGFLYPAFTGGTVTHFRSPEAVTMWEYMKDLWAQCVPASTNFEFMQEPLASNQVQVAWDHVARLVDAPKDAPDDFVMVPVPAGPKGRAYMSVLVALAIPKGAPRREDSEKVIEALSKSDVQIEVLRQNAFFPAVKATVPADLPPAVKLEAQAVDKQQAASDALITLIPVGLGGRDGDLNQVFKDAFTNIVLKNKPIQSTLDEQAKILQDILDETKAACWKPDQGTPGQPCQVG